jgi:apoptosis-inducing factor 2
MGGLRSPPCPLRLARGTVRRDRAVRVAAHTVDLASGAQVTADYVVLVTGSTHRYPAKIDVPDSARGKDKLRGTHQALAAAGDVLLLGAGPVGLEFAGEIKAAWPDKRVTLVDPRPALAFGQFPAQFGAELAAQLAGLGIALLLGTSLRDQPPTAPGELGAFVAVTSRANASAPISGSSAMAPPRPSITWRRT